MVTFDPYLYAQDFLRGFKERESRLFSLAEGQRMFGLPRSTFGSMVALGRELGLLSSLYSLSTQVGTALQQCRQTRWSDFEGDMTNTQVKTLYAVSIFTKL